MVGEIRRPWGRYGDLSATLYSGLETPIRPGWKIYINGETHIVEDIGNAGKGGMVLTLKGVNGSHAAGGFRKAIIEIDADALPPPPEGMYYGHQLMGLRVVTVDGDEIGTIIEIIETGANDVYGVKPESPDKQDVMVPALADVIVNVDLEAGLMTVNLPEGLM
ncbi:MAG: 16S rRNA processing protein RimM [Chloroflexi bacterium]|nr:16S rRNA processing protein RimM [Chloroflexota bacterium]